MKKLLQFFAVAALLAGSTATAQALNVTFNATSDKAASATSSITKGAITLNGGEGWGDLTASDGKYTFPAGANIELTATNAKIHTVIIYCAVNNAEAYFNENQDYMNGADPDVPLISYFNNELDFEDLESGYGDIYFTVGDQELKVNSIYVDYESTKTPAGISFNKNAMSTNSWRGVPGEAFEAPVLNNPNNLTITYSSSNTAVATVDAATGAVTITSEPTAFGTTKSARITATSAETGTYAPGTATYDIIVASVPVSTLPFTETFAQADGTGGWDGNFSAFPASVSKAAPVFDNANTWEHITALNQYVNVFKGYQCMIMGTRYATANIVSPRFSNFNGDAKIKFQTIGWESNTKTDGSAMRLSLENGVFADGTTAQTFTAPKGKLTDFEFQFSGNETTRFKLEVTETNNVTYVGNISVEAVTTGADQLNADKTVAGVQFVNLAGQVSNAPFQGVNLQVTTYTDGSRQVTKVIK